MSTFSEYFKLSNKGREVINNFLYNRDNSFIWLEGAAQCGKSIIAALMISLEIEKSDENNNIFLAIGYSSTSAINNVFKAGGFGVENYFGDRCIKTKYGSGIDCLKIKTNTGFKYLLAFGGGTKSSSASFHGYSASGIIIDEADRLHSNTIDEVLQRLQARPQAKGIFTMNPTFEKHPIYKLLDTFIARNQVQYSHWLLDDNPALSAEDIENIKNRYDPNSLYYQRYILGNRVNPEGSIYTLYDYSIIDDWKPEDYIDYVTVCDQGESISASSFVMVGLTYDKIDKQMEIHVLKSRSYLNNGKNGYGVKMFADTANDYCQFIRECADIMHRMPTRAYIDQNVEFYRNARESFIKRGWSLNLLKYAIKNSIELRIQQGLNLLYEKKLKFYRACTDVIDDFNNAQYDTKKLSIGKLERDKSYTINGHLDSIDSTEYGFTHFINKVSLK